MSSWRRFPLFRWPRQLGDALAVHAIWPTRSFVVSRHQMLPPLRLIQPRLPIPVGQQGHGFCLKNSRPAFTPMRLIAQDSQLPRYLVYLHTFLPPTNNCAVARLLPNTNPVYPKNSFSYFPFAR